MARIPGTNDLLTPLAQEVLDALAEHYGLARNSVIEMLLRDRARDLGYLSPPHPLDSPDEVASPL